MLNKLVVDISHHQKSVDPLPLLEAEVQLVIIKADDLFTRHGKIFANAGMPIAAYHWIDPIKDPLQQANATLDLIRNSNLPVVSLFVDFEQWWSDWDKWLLFINEKLLEQKVPRFNGDHLSSHAKQVFETFQASNGKPIGYTSASFVREHSPQAAEWMGDFQWWLAHYGTYNIQSLTWQEFKSKVLPTVNFSPNLPDSVTTQLVVGHQFTGDKFKLPGAYSDDRRTKPSPADVSLFDGEFLTGIGAVPNPKPLSEAHYEAVVTSTTLNVRSGPGTSFEVLYTLKKGEGIELTSINDERWAKLRSFGEEWCSEQNLQIMTATPDDNVTEEDLDTLEDRTTQVNIPGVTYHFVRRFGTDCHILLIDTVSKRFHVTPFTSLRTVSQAAQSLGVPIVVNGDGWGINNRFPNSIAASDGNFYQKSRMDFRPWINISKDNKVTFDWKNPSGLYNAVSGDRFLIQKGKYNEAIQAVNKDPRTTIGFTKDGKLILIVADGRTPQSAGLSFREMSDILLGYNTETAINLDGGGSSALWINDKVVNVPIDQGIPGKERLVANHLCIFIG